METGVLGFSKDIEAVLSQIRRVSGGDFLSARGTGLSLEMFLYKTYSKELIYSMARSTRVWMIITQGFCWVERAPFA